MGVPLTLILPDRDSHWYDATGKPCYEVKMTTKEGMRPVTIADARKLSLVPSVTTIMGVVAKPGLEVWKQTQAIFSALTLPRFKDETEDAFAKRVVQDMKEESRAAAGAGTDIHDIIEHWLHNNISKSLTKEETTFLELFTSWYKEQGLQMQATEKSFALTSEGFGGRVDYVGFFKDRRCILDWKTQATKADLQVRFYPEYGAQLAAYAVGIFGLQDATKASLLSVVVSRNEVGRIEMHEYEFEPYWKAFVAAKDLWYSPLGPGNTLKG